MKLPRFFILISIFSFLVSPTAFAHESIFFEYAPDAWQSKRYTVSSGGTPYQLFQPSRNFTMTGFDVWLDNTSGPGSVTLTLADSAGTVLSTKQTTVSTLNPAQGGHKFHVDLDSSVNLISSEVYSIQIYSNLLGLGLYYADRTLVLEHNREYGSEYSSGAAKIGQEIKDFTFKFALYEPQSSSGSSPPPPAPSPSPPTEIIITNARVVSVTDTTALFAWTTNAASDSRVTVRTQLNPLYVIASGYDPTFELEHAVLVTGLSPSTNYFGDVFSSTGSEILSTYTIGFQTAAATTPPPSPPTPNPTPNPPPPSPTPTPPSPTPNSPSPAPNPPSPGPSPSPNPQSSSGQGGGSGSQVEVEPGGSDGSVTVTWPAASGGSPSGGYRIDIFDENFNLVKQLTAPADANELTVERLESGTHYATIYANEDGTFIKVAPQKSFVLTESSGSFINKVILLSFVWIASAAGYIYWKHKRAEARLKPKTEYTSL